MRSELGRHCLFTYMLRSKVGRTRWGISK